MRAVLLSLALLLVPAAGCSASSGPLFGTSGSGASGTASTGSMGTGGTGAGTSGTSGTGATGMGGLGLGGFVGTGGNTSSDCTTASELLYVFDTNNNIWSFNPALVTSSPTQNPFTLITTANCPLFEPNSMAVDRNVVAWLNYQDGNGAIFTIDLKTQGAPCNDSGISLPSGFNQVGMGFSADVSGGQSETLYLDGIAGTGLAKVDMTTKTLTQVGDFSNDAKLTGQSCELTGTGNALLYGYFTTSPYVRVAQLDKTAGKVLSDYELSGVSPPSDWAFSFWGGSFYLYAGPNENGNTTVVKYTPATSTSPAVVDPNFIADVGVWNQGMLIIGAGNTTCAPITPPM